MASEVICWNCSTKTEVGYCHNCGVEIVDPNAQAEEVKNKFEEQEKSTMNYLDQLNYSYYNVLYFLIGTNILIYLATTLLSGSVLDTSSEIYQTFGSSFIALQEGRYYVLITSMFIHGSFLHIFFNMYWVYILTERLAKLGYSNAGLLISYFVTGIISGFLSALVDPFTYSIGASGAILGWIGMYIFILRRMESPNWKRYFQYATIYVVISFFIPGISFFGHLFGFLTGIIIGYTSIFDKLLMKT